MEEPSFHPEVQAFLKQIDDLLQQVGRPFTGIFVTCRYCKEPALAASPEVAVSFGWTELRPVSNSIYQGTCLDCNRLGNSKELPMNEWLDIGSSPPGESCAQVGTEEYYPQARRECRAYINQLRRALGQEPPGARLGIKSNPHDFGDYLSVVCYFDPNSQEAVAYAYRSESEGPEEWDEEARKELQQTKRGGA